MSVLCVQIPGFLLQIAYRAAPDLRDRPAALLDAHERVCALNAPARREGVTLAMRPQQALACCPDVTLRAADLDEALGLQGELLAAMTALGLPVEEHGWGRAYLDLHAGSAEASPRSAARQPDEAQATAAALGKTLRATLGEPLVPALGWDSGKFTARAAASYTAPGRMKLVRKRDEPRFLSPLPTRLLPLARPNLQELSWLGIETLGQFGQLPVQAVVQRFGPPGRTAHEWARGLDRRPVRPTAVAPTETLACFFDPPAATLEPVLAALQATLQPQLAMLCRTLCGIRSLHLALTFSGQETRSLPLLFVEPVGEIGRVMRHVRAGLEALNWPQRLERAEIKRLESGELTVEQGALFDEPAATTLSLAELVARLAPRYGRIFRQGRAVDPSHPLAERRFVYTVP